MKKLLPILLIGFFFFTFFFSIRVFAADGTSATATTPQTGATSGCPATIPDGEWCESPEVTFTGKIASRANDFLNFTLENYSWSFVKNGETNPLATFWVTIRNIIYAMLLLVVLATGFVLVITRGKSLTIKKFIPRFVLIIVLVTLSFAVIQFLYQIGDIIQGFFLKNTQGKIIQSSDLLSIGFDYKDFIGYRLKGIKFDESAFISLLLVKLTTVTYFIMAGLLIVRKIILWFFIAVSPIFPLLLMYAPVRNTAKIWLGEFMRWLLYGPLFAVLLSGLVAMWSSGVRIPLDFKEYPNVNSAPADALYPTAINILIAGPGQTAVYTGQITNSVNTKETFALYVIALLMLWAVMILPFVLLKIFLDYFHSYAFAESPWLKQIVAGSTTLMRKSGFPPSPSGPPTPSPSGSTGLARALPFANKAYISETKSHETLIPTTTQNFSYSRFNAPARVTTQSLNNTEVLKLADLFVPSLRDVARYETSLITNNATTSNTSNREVAHFTKTLEQLANPSSITSTAEKERFTTLRQQLIQEQQKGNPIAQAVLAASNMSTVGTSTVSSEHIQQVLTQISHPETVSSPQKQMQYAAIKEELSRAQAAGDPLATAIMTAVNTGQISSGSQLQELLIQESKKGNQLATKLLAEVGISPTGTPQGQLGQKQSQISKSAQFPVINRVQSVSLDDYEAVKKMWVENYKKLDPPKSTTGEKSRKQWVEEDIGMISNAITLLTSPDPKVQKEGMDKVAYILPFLLIGGFSKNEVLAYLKSKLEAAKAVDTELKQQDEEESTMLSSEHKKKEEHGVMHMEEAKDLTDPLAASEEKNPSQQHE